MSTLKVTAIIVLFIFIFIASGCSTIVAHSENKTPLPYTGTKTAIKKVKKSWYDYDFYGQIYIYVLDTPFSFIADTLLFPLDTYRFKKAKSVR